MIVIRFHGGLGNQMFEYTFYEYMRQRYPEHIKADLSWFDRNYNAHQGYELSRAFGIELPAVSYEDLARIHEYFPKYYPFAALRFLSRKIAKYKNDKRRASGTFTENYINDFGPTQYGKNDVFDHLDTGKDWYLEGVYCSDAYLAVCEDAVKKAFTFKEKLSADNQLIADKMATDNSVAIHVRRGDYVGNVFDVVTVDYYRAAVEYIKSKVDDPVFYVFSDDMDYINSKFTFLGEYVPVHNSGKASYVDMRLMSLCKHCIIANSSFSYWGAVLGETKDSIVIAPKQYKADENLALARSNWILM